MARVNTCGLIKVSIMMVNGLIMHVKVKQKLLTSTMAKSKDTKATSPITRDKDTAHFTSMIKVCTKENGRTT
jgi:hypothetical protein